MLPSFTSYAWSCLLLPIQQALFHTSQPFPFLELVCAEFRTKPSGCLTLHQNPEGELCFQTEENLSNKLSSLLRAVIRWSKWLIFVFNDTKPILKNKDRGAELDCNPLVLMEMPSQAAGQFSATLTLVVQLQSTCIQFINKSLVLVLRARSVGTQKHEHLLLQLWFWLSLLTCSLSRAILEVFGKLPSYLQMVCNSDSSCSKSKREGRWCRFFAMFTNF